MLFGEYVDSRTWWAELQRQNVHIEAGTSMDIGHTENPGEPSTVEQKGLIRQMDTRWSKGLTLYIQGPWARARARVGADQISP